MAAIPLYALNDLAIKTKLKVINPTTGVVSPLTSGTVTAFLATTNTASAVAAAPALTMSPTHLGGGVWLIFFDGAVLTTALLDPIFGSVAPYLIVQQPGDVRVYAALSYATTRPALVG